MKNIVLSADGDRRVYSVPDTVADNLEQYCLNFCDWLESSPQAKNTDGIRCCAIPRRILPITRTIGCFRMNNRSMLQI